MPLYDLRSTSFPYCLQRQPDGGYVLLNREYKPLGWTSSKPVAYADFPISQRIKGLTKTKAKALSYQGKEDLDCIILYGDGCVPGSTSEDTAAYFARLEILLKLQLE